MKFSRIIKSVIFIFAASLILCGCPALEDLETGSVTFTISSDVADAIESAGAQSSYRSVNTSNLFFKISIKGDYEAEKTIAATAGSTATFDGIPVYKRIHAEASAYEQNNDGTHNVLYTGTSNTIVIRKGTNTISLALQATGSGSGGGSTTQTSYTISYTFNGGTNPSGAPTSYTSANLPLTLPTPTKTGARFGGWYTTSDFQASSKVTQIPSGTTGTYTVWAKWIDFAVGDILLTDGSFITSAQVTSENVNSIVGIVYALDENNVPRGVLGIKNTSSKNWVASSCSQKTRAYVDPKIKTSYTGSGSVYDFDEEFDTDGSDNWAIICSQELTGTADAATNYPAFDWINKYGTSDGAANYLSTTSYYSGWYMPSLKEMAYIHNNRVQLNNVLNQISDATPLQTTGNAYYWSSSTRNVGATEADDNIYVMNFSNTNATAVSTYRYQSFNVLCVHKIETNTIIYSLNGGTNASTNPASSASASASTPITLAAPTKTGAIFDGWYDNPNFTGTRVTQITEAGYPTLYAKWLEGFVLVNGTTVSGAVSGSSVFNGRTITIPTMYVCDHEVTQAEYQAVMGSNPSSFTSGVASGETQILRPVDYVSWYDAIAYCNKKSANENLTPCYSISGITNWSNFSYSNIPTSNNDTWNAVTCNWSANGYRLPTEAEWEYIARGGNNGIPSTQYTYSGSNTPGDVAWYGVAETSGGKTHEVKKKNPNTLGIYDMSGNVYERCWDWRTENITLNTPATGLTSSDSGRGRVVRGGYFGAGTSDAFSFFYSVYGQNEFDPDVRNRMVGFRVVRTVQ